MLKLSRKGRRHGQLYDWDRWFKRARFKLVKGKHYAVNSYVMYQQIRNQASKRGLLVTIKVKDDSVSVTNVRAA